MENDIIQKTFDCEVKQLDNDRQFRLQVSNEDVDRDGDIVRQSGLKYENFNKNPIVLYNHNRDKPIAKVISIETKETQTYMDIEFPRKEVSKLADEVCGLLQEKILRAASIGFLPVNFGWLDGGDIFEYKEAELLELSVVTIPSNSGAIAVNRSFKDSVKKPDEKEEAKEEKQQLNESEKLFIEIEEL